MPPKPRNEPADEHPTEPRVSPRVDLRQKQLRERIVIERLQDEQNAGTVWKEPTSTAWIEKESCDLLGKRIDNNLAIISERMASGFDEMNMPPLTAGPMARSSTAPNSSLRKDHHLAASHGRPNSYSRPKLEKDSHSARRQNSYSIPKPSPVMSSWKSSGGLTSIGTIESMTGTIRSSTSIEPMPRQQLPNHLKGLDISGLRKEHENPNGLRDLHLYTPTDHVPHAHVPHSPVPGDQEEPVRRRVGKPWTKELSKSSSISTPSSQRQDPDDLQPEQGNSL